MEENTNVIPIDIGDDTAREKIFITVEGEEVQISLADAGIDFDDSESNIMDRVAPMVEEQTGVDITDSYKIRKMLNNRNIFIIPNSVAG